MQNIQTVSTKELRDNLSEILEQVAVGGQNFIVYKFGKKKALLTPVEVNNVKKKKIDFTKFEAYGMWSGRKDMKDSEKWVVKERSSQSRKKSIFS